MKKTKSEILNNFKNKTFDWQKNKLTDEEFLDEIEILFESSFMEITGVEQGSFKETQFFIPQWVKKIASFWHENSITDQEFYNALKYILEIELDRNYDPY